MAGLEGGAIFYKMNPPLSLEDNQYLGNSAVYGADFASYPTTLRIIDNETRQWMHELSSGQAIQHDLVIGIFDQNEQLVVTDSESECII
jgi:hypothetical protein